MVPSRPGSTTVMGSDGDAAARRGQSMVELAFVMPVLLLLTLGVLDLGRLYADYVDLKTAARDGAGYGMMHPTDTAGMKSRVLGAGVPSGTVATASCAPSAGCSTIDGTGQVVVSAESVFKPVTLGFFSWLGTDGAITVKATAKMRVLT
ncbi:MAG: hypothetical protein QOF73_2406 [Thermomicrobiales bacterium]|nr:hypothetical protein [Thermomicrobiales bacterium]